MTFSCQGLPVAANIREADPNANNQIGNMNQEKLEMAPVNNLDPERAVGFINYELKLRGAKELQAASRAHVKGKGVSLIEGKRCQQG